MAELAWFKSSYSGSEGDSCIEVAVEAHEEQDTVHVRDSKLHRSPQLTVSSTSWRDFVSYARKG